VQARAAVGAKNAANPIRAMMRVSQFTGS
jgi:hypothetical protein